MPIEFDTQSVDVSGVDDRRGRGAGGIAVGGGVGVVGVIIYLLVTLLGGGGSGQLLLPDGGTGAAGGSGSDGVSGETAAQLSARCNASGAIQRYTDCRLIKTFNVADSVWSAEFARRGLTYSSPRFAFFSGSTDTGCGPASAAVGPFYCPADQEIYLDLGFLDELQTTYGVAGQFAQAYVVAHEFGHHLQTLLGTEPAVRAAAQRNPGQANTYSIALELQADCYAGVWSTLAGKSAGNGIRLTQANIDEAVNAAQAVGDDRIQAETQGRVNPESWTHGSAAQRSQWFLIGEQSGDLDNCKTFGA